MRQQARSLPTEALAPDLGLALGSMQQSPIVALLRQRAPESALLVGHEPDLSHLALFPSHGYFEPEASAQEGRPVCHQRT